MDDDTCKPFEEKFVKQKGSIFALTKTVFCKVYSNVKFSLFPAQSAFLSNKLIIKK
jgi:hypothetical protein